MDDSNKITNEQSLETVTGGATGSDLKAKIEDLQPTLNETPNPRIPAGLCPHSIITILPEN